MNTLVKIFFLNLILLIPTLLHSQCDDVITNVTIQDNQDTDYEFIVSGALNNDLADVAQGICGIQVEFFHNAVSDLVFQLTSPTGQTITLVGDVDSNSPITTSARWDINFVQCSDQANPDPTIGSTWDNTSAWTNLGIYTGSYYPKTGCLEDFNSGPVNGTWTLRIVDGAQFNAGSLVSFSVTFCDDTGISCFECAAEAGSLTNVIQSRCTNDDLSFDFDVTGENTDPNYSYAYVVSQNGNLTSINMDTDLTGLTAGNYEVCGVSILTSDLPTLLSSTLSYSEIISGINDRSLGLCADLSDACTLVEIAQAPALVMLDETICGGEDFRLGDSILTIDGSYSVTVQSLMGCDTNYLVNLEVIDLQPIITSSAPAFSCNVSDITLDAFQSIQEGFSDFTWSTTNGVLVGDVNTSEIVIQYPGTYVLTQEEDGCPVTTQLIISNDASVPNVNVSSVPISCGNTIVELMVASGSNIISAEWSGPNNFTSQEVEPMVSIEGDYFARVVDANGCSVNIQHAVTQDANVPNIVLTAGELSCENSSVIINVASDSLFQNFSWTGPDGFVSDLESPTVTAVGSYNLTAESMGGCIVQKTIDISGNLQTFNYEVLGSTFLCNGGSTRIEASTSIPGTFYVWTGPGNFTSSIANPLVTVEGTYYVDIIANGCVVTDSVLVDRDISQLPEYEVRIDTLGDCENPLFRLTAVPIANEQQVSLIRWVLNGVGIVGTGSQVEVNTVGTYVLLISSFNGCLVRENLTLAPLPNAPLITRIAKANVTCTTGLNSGVLEVNYDPNFTYNWTGPDGFVADTSRLESLADGFYDLTVVDNSSGCFSFFSDRIVADTIPRNSTVTSTEINCNNSISNVRLVSNGGGNTYFWQGPSETFSTPSFSTMQAGDYFLTITGGNGCITLDTANVISDFNPPNIILVDSVLNCSTNAAPLVSITSDAGLIYSWEGPNDFEATSASPTVFTAGDYMLTVTGLNGCSTTDVLQIITNPDMPVPLLTASSSLNCIDTSATIFGDADRPVESILWEGPNDFQSDLENIQISEPGTYYIRMETDLNCVGRDSITIDETIVLPERQFEFGSIGCIIDTSLLSASSPDAGAIFSWTGPNGFSKTGNLVSAIDTGIYILQVRGSNNCVSMDTFGLSTDNEVLSETQIINCDIPYLNIAALSDNLDFDIDWTGPDGFASSEFQPLVTASGIYQAIISGSNGCISNASVAITMDTISPTAVATALNDLKCQVTEVSLTGQGSSSGSEFTYEWTTNGSPKILTDSSAIDIVADGAGLYFLQVIDTTNWCIDTAILDVNMLPSDILGFDFSSSDPICNGDSNGAVDIINIDGGTGPFTYSLDSFFFTDNSSFEGLPAGNYSTYVQDSFGCITSNQITINEVDPIVLDLGDNIDVFLGDETVISANTNLTMEQIESIRWQIADQIGCADCLSFSLSPSQDVRIELTIMDERGCVVTDLVNVRVDQEPVLFKPNVFSPNEDGINDIFYLSSNAGVAEIKSIAIFDRWGSKVFENFNFMPGDATAGWDGTRQGNKLLPGVYVYTVEVEMISGIRRVIKGDVAIVR